MSACERPIRVLLVDDHRSILWGLEKLIESAHPRIETVASVTCIADALAAAERDEPDIVLLDLDLGEENGLDIIPQLVRSGETRVIVLTGVRDEEIRERAVIAGARGLLHKSEPADYIIKAIEEVHAGQLWLDRGTITRVFAALSNKANDKAQPLPHSELTSAELKIITAVVKHKGAPNKVIAGSLNISAHTLRNHLASVYAKLGVHRRLDLVLYALEYGLDKPCA